MRHLFAAISLCIAMAPADVQAKQQRHHHPFQRQLSCHQHHYANRSHGARRHGVRCATGNPVFGWLAWCG